MHRQIKAVLHGDATAAELSNNDLSGLSARLATVRAQATREAELWLQCEFLASSVGEEFEAVVAQISSSGFTAKLIDNGIEGQVDLRKDPEKFSFDRWAATLTSPSRSFRLEQTLRVRLERVDPTRREILFVPVSDSDPNLMHQPNHLPDAQLTQVSTHFRCLSAVGEILSPPGTGYRRMAAPVPSDRPVVGAEDQMGENSPQSPSHWGLRAFRWSLPRSSINPWSAGKK